MTGGSDEPRWIARSVALAIHGDQIRQHGGAHGIRDEGLLDSALHRARHRFEYAADSDLLVLGACYCTGIARNHPFLDGNKRAAFQTMYVFLGLNGRRIEALETEVVTLMLGVAEGSIDEAGLATWLKGHTVAR